jgi:hypothetical protein
MHVMQATVIEYTTRLLQAGVCVAVRKNTAGFNVLIRRENVLFCIT